MKYLGLLLLLLTSAHTLSWGQSSPELPLAGPAPDSVLSTVTTSQLDSVAPQSAAKTKTSLKQRLQNKINEPFDTTRNSGYWWRAMKHGKVDFNDPTMGYPKFVKFCYKAYKWGDKAFNSYDTAYVVSTGKNWKLTLKNRNWIDHFDGRNQYGDMLFTSCTSSNIGLHLSFMALSVGYSIDIDRIFGGKKMSEMMEFSFTCARFTAEFRKTKNYGSMKSRFKPKGGKWQNDDKITALQRETMGFSATYFFNNRKYARAAAYCYSKFQRRSAGSPLAGLSIINYDFDIDYEKLEPAEIEELKRLNVGHVRYTDYCLRGGYAYNWVMNSKFLLNVTGMLGGGVKHIHSTEIQPSANTGALHLSANVAITYNHRRFFASVQSNVNTSLNFEKDATYDYTIGDLTAVLGLRF